MGNFWNVCVCVCVFAVISPSQTTWSTKKTWCCWFVRWNANAGCSTISIRHSATLVKTMIGFQQYKFCVYPQGKYIFGPQIWVSAKINPSFFLNIELCLHACLWILNPEEYLCCILGIPLGYENNRNAPCFVQYEFVRRVQKKRFAGDIFFIPHHWYMKTSLNGEYFRSQWQLNHTPFQGWWRITFKGGWISSWTRSFTSSQTVIWHFTIQSPCFPMLFLWKGSL